MVVGRSFDSKKKDIRMCEMRERYFIAQFDVVLSSLANMAYRHPHEFLNNESTKEVLVFKFRPTVDGEFPNYLRMNMTQMLRYFEPSWYIFDMTPSK